MFFRRKKEIHPYNPAVQKPVIRSSICTGEKVAGFRNRDTGKFEEVMVIRDEKDLRRFLETYRIPEGEISTEY